MYLLYSVLLYYCTYSMISPLVINAYLKVVWAKYRRIGFTQEQWRVSSGEFNPGRESLLNYDERMEQFFEETDTEEDKKIVVFLSVICPESYGILRNLMQRDLQKEKDERLASGNLEETQHAKVFSYSASV